MPTENEQVLSEHFFPLRPYPKIPNQRTLCPFSTQIIFTNMLLGFFLYFMTLPFMLSSLKNKSFNFHCMISISSVTTFCLSFLASVFEASRSQEEIAAKFCVYHSCSSLSFASLASPSCIPFQPADDILLLFHFLPFPLFSGQMCPCNSYPPHFPDLTYKMYYHPVYKLYYNEIIHQKVLLFRYLK